MFRGYKGYLIDLDGTMYKGNEVIDQAPQFIQSLVEKDIPYLFLTNNSSRTSTQVAEKLNHLGIEASAKNVFTSSMATAKYIKQTNPNAICYVIGEEGLFDALQKENVKVADDHLVSNTVVVGIDRYINYEKLACACLAVRNGASFISTNSDHALPTERGLLPGNGALTTVISVSTGVKPQFIGKPETIIVDQALHELGTTKEETILVGDNYNTDIRAGISSGMDTLMVFTGVTPFKDYDSLPIKPTYYVRDLSEWL
ncbi:TIGR01457 family HAD-type hydrolase [Ornithinibacillus halotolerans]|uniref:Acid sugar phosphatase n=1 Tax=Ornithinibacillus halotolerans TaxID=1274357 RepID=A0A916RZ84_9BACI|nr:TIGR01457 family HAD-type hydrolase [Ornithinibacillus halotolerans]GGA76723.1 haloacid dehalogenase [Ornithinibacillus halotolerans]